MDPWQLLCVINPPIRLRKVPYLGVRVFSCRERTAFVNPTPAFVADDPAADMTVRSTNTAIERHIPSTYLRYSSVSPYIVADTRGESLSYEWNEKRQPMF